MATQQGEQTNEKKEDNGKNPQQQSLQPQPADQAVARPSALTGPFALMRQLFEDLEQMWTGVRRPMHARAEIAGFMPQIEVAEHDDKLVVKADLPGISPDDVEVTLRDDALVIQGERHSEYEKQQGNVWRSERTYGAFHRVIPLPEGVDPNTCDAHFDNGVLEVTVAAPHKESRTRKVEIQHKVQH